jgi:hypothetical protein
VVKKKLKVQRKENMKVILLIGVQLQKVIKQVKILYDDLCESGTDLIH